MICGVCGGGVRGFSGSLHGRPIKDWKHTSVPPGTEPHRPVLGTPVDEDTLARFRREKEQARAAKLIVDRSPVEVDEPLVRPRLAKSSEIPASALRTVDLADAYGWAVEAPTYWRSRSDIETVVVRARRRDLGVVAVWEKKNGTANPRWSYVLGGGVVRGRIRQVGSESLKDFIKQRQEICPDCGASSAAHDEGKCP